MLCDNGGVPASQLEREGRERLGRLLRDDLGDDLSASVEDLVPLLVEQGRRLGDGALDARVAVRVEGLAQDLLDCDGGVGGRLGGLDDGRASCCDGADERAEGELDGEVVGANDEHGAQWVLLDAWTEGHVCPRDVSRLLVLCEARHVVGHPDAVVHAPRDLGQVCLERRLAQVALARLLDELFIVLEAPVQLPQLLDAVLERLGLVREEAGAYLCARGRDVVHGRVLERG